MEEPRLVIHCCLLNPVDKVMVRSSPHYNQTVSRLFSLTVVVVYVSDSTLFVVKNSVL